MWNDIGRPGNINGTEAEVREMFCNDAVMGDKDAFTEIFRNAVKTTQRTCVSIPECSTLTAWCPNFKMGSVVPNPALPFSTYRK